jgi:sterol O-acyltransferase
VESGKDGFRGFYTLFWIGIGLTILNTFYASYRSTGHVLSMTFATLFSKDAKILALSDAVLVGSLFLCVPFAQIAQKGLLPYSKCLVYFQHLWQAAMLGAVIKWTHFREWPWVQSGFFVLHTISMMMKIHSYMSVNGNMADTFWRMRRKEQQLRERVLEVAGVRPTGDHQKDEKVMKETWKEACRTALGSEEELVESAWSSLEAQERTSPIRYLSRSSSVTKAKRLSLTGAPEGISSWSNKAVPTVQTEARAAPESTTQEKASGAAPAEAKDSKKKASAEVQMLIRDPHPLATHPDAVISKLASDIEVMREELLSTGPHDEIHSAHDSRVAWPHNISYANFWDYLLIPSLVYELEFPRTKSIRPLYILEKVGATLGTFFVIYVITEHWIMPFQPGPGQSLIETFLQLAVPMMINYLLIFYIMFECICNAFAEFTR